MLAILLDLDGTIIDSAPGIVASYRHMMESYGVAAPAPETMRWVIGPPPRQTVPKLIGPDHDVERAVGLYRAYYAEHRLFDAVVYDGMEAALAELKALPARLFVCTAKLDRLALPVMRHFGLDALFDGIHGADPAGRFDDKALLIAHIVATHGLDPARVIMVGDRANDMQAAVRQVVPAIGALWGYGDAQELTGTGATILCASPVDLPGTVRILAGERGAAA